MSVKKTTMDISARSLLDLIKSTKNIFISEKKIMDKKDKHIYPITNVPFSTPNTWEWSYLSDISIIQEGPGIRKHQYRNEGVQFLTVTNILEGSVDLKKSEKYISTEEYNNKYLHFTIKKGDIVTACSGGSWGKSSIYDLNSKIILNTSTLRLRFFNDLGENKYLYYLTKSTYFKKSLSSHSTGQQPNYGYSHYSKIPIPLPSLPEQQRIVSILDGVFEGIAKATANAEKNLLNARELFESYLNGVFDQKSEGWVEKRLKGFTKSISTGPFGSLLHKSDYVNEGVPLVNPINIVAGKIVPDPLKLIDKATKKRLKNYVLEKGDIAIGRRGEIGRCAVVDENQDGWVCGTGCFFIRPLVDVNPNFLAHLIRSNTYRMNLENAATGTTMKNLSNKSLSNLVVSIPPIETQIDLLDKLSDLGNHTKHLETIYQQKLNALAELKQAILHKAFTGELTTDNVDKQMEAV